ncbi:hypothetical protein PP304_gp125 [Gordonia phage Phendrix]|uniref:Uncharacterized protein n=1 Tax=Gordonia phage Phendrix TaxID=2593335 RepID=A0A514U1A5_9CAUD|nr:hypothetical protein PP304_gp012 [Gordonia phage Phendrix]YP_010649242.1 hypothetical protein PP304_gp125 [Gordonia phage Phendrix]QDK02560.1 hypothetical protein SEA_PHENDRIX_12 [Gordonia phage Phendrix]QDK02744.1 hypothetical protein SEA_PHENDRIX_228 [Gordonia phage Phendrix]
MNTTATLIIAITTLFLMFAVIADEIAEVF